VESLFLILREFEQISQQQKKEKIRVAFQVVSSHFFGIGIYPVSIHPVLVFSVGIYVL